MRTPIVAGCLAMAILASRSDAAAAAHLPSDQQVLTFIAETIDWYRHLPTAQRIGTEPSDLLFLEDNRPITTEIVQLSFEFGKAVAAADPAESSSDPQATHARPATGSEWQYLTSAKARLDANTQQAVNQLDSLTRAKLTARGADRTQLAAQMTAIQSRVQLLSAMSANYQSLLGFVRNAAADPDRPTNLAALVENLERTVPDVSAAAHPSQISNIPLDPSRLPSGITAMISQVSALARKERLIDGLIERTDALSRSLQNMRKPFTDYYRKQFSSLSLDPTSLDVLQRQQSSLTDLLAEARSASPAIAALIKQQTLLKLYRTHLNEWRSEIQTEYHAAWKALLVRLGILATAIVMLLGINVVVRRLAYRHVRDLEARQMLLIGQRVLLWLIVIVLVLFAFAFDLSSLATFLGLVSAGLAVGLHDVFLAIGGYLLIIRKFHVRVGDRVQISGVSGEVTNLGLLEFELSEADTTTGQRTGRVAYFSNSYVFVSPATPLFRRVSAPA